MKLTDYGKHVIWNDKWECVEYSLHGKTHRTDGPAIIWLGGDRFYFLRGKRHRIDGSAMIYFRGEAHYYLHGEKYPNKEEYEIEVNRLRQTRNMGQ